MKEYIVKQEDLEINIKYDDNKDLVEKLDKIICDLVSYGYGAWMDVGTDGIIKAIKENPLYEEDIELKNKTYDKNHDL